MVFAQFHIATQQMFQIQGFSPDRIKLESPLFIDSGETEALLNADKKSWQRKFMIHSMSGFATGSRKINASQYTIEIKSVNHRYLDLSFKWSKFYTRWEEKLQSMVRKRLRRGRIDIWVNVENDPTGHLFSQENLMAAKAYVNGIKKMQKQLGLSGTIDISLATRFIEENRNLHKNALDRDYDSFSKLFDKVLGSLNTMRAREGKNLQQDLLARKKTIAEAVKKIKEHGANTIKDLPQKMATRIKEHLSGQEIDTGRLNQELAFFMEKTDVSEELVRIDSHLQQFELYINENPAEGKKLEFLLQELQREFNTLSVKIRSSQVSQWVVQVKSELEKMREQILNVE